MFSVLYCELQSFINRWFYELLRPISDTETGRGLSSKTLNMSKRTSLHQAYGSSRRINEFSNYFKFRRRLG